MASVRLSSQERRAQIIETAVRLFSERGFRGTTTREIALNVGVTEPVLYQHFKTKRDLYDAIIEDLARTGDQAVPDCINHMPPPGGDRQFLVDVANGIIDWHVSNPHWVRLLLLAALEAHEFQDLVHRRYADAFCEQMKGYFSRRIQEGLYRAMDPWIQAQAFLSMFVHYAMNLSVLNKAGQLPRAEIVDGLVDIFLKGIQA